MTKNIRQILMTTLAVATVMVSVAGLLAVSLPAHPVWADAPAAPADPNAPPPRDCARDFCSPFRGNTKEEKEASQPQDSQQGNLLITEYVGPVAAALSALVGIAVAASVIFAGIQYSTAGGDSGKVSAAKQRILKAIVVLAAYVFFYAFIQWLVADNI